MKLSTPIKNGIIEIICLLYILLFVYAAMSKLLDFENFQVQLGQSPLLSAFAGYLAWLIPMIELLIAIFLIMPKYRLAGLFAGLGLMIMFTVYIYLILNYSSFIPCSCGGVLEKMNWKEHLYFNVGFCCLAIVGLYFRIKNKIYLITRIAIVFSFSAILMIGLHIRSEQIVYKENNFIRRFPPFPAKRVNAEMLISNNYYFAGKSHDKIYLGNSTAPSVITELDLSLRQSNSYKIQIRDTLFKFLNVKLKVDPPLFFYL